jgi:trk system potassium uptake protein TrkA
MPIDEDVLRSAGIERADALAAVTNDDNMNIMISQIARELYHVPVVITRLYDPERDAVHKRLGLTTICPTTLAVEKLKEMLIPQNGLVTVEMAGVSISFKQMRPGKRQIGKSIADIREFFVFGIIKNGQFQFARAKAVVEAGDMLVIPEYAGQEGEEACI